jgi:osmotically-inducible protein OsmY
MDMGDVAAQRRGLSMTRKFTCSLLLALILMVCQSESQEPSTTSAQAAPESGAQAQQSEQPIQARLQEKAAANEDIQSNLQSALDDDPILSGADLETQVNDESITVAGTVQSYWQYQRVLQLVSPYSGSRNIVDKINVQ